MYKLRNYQQLTINRIVGAMREGKRAIMVQQPPRTGKTVIMAEIARRATLKGNRVLFVVHRKELVDQARQTFKRNDVDMSLVTMGMVQTLTRHNGTIPKPAVILIDEAHHVLAKSYRRIIDAFPDAVRIMVTATPWRMSGAGFGDVADCLIPGQQMGWLIKNGFLAPIRYFCPPDINTVELKLKANGEFDEASVADAMKPKVFSNAVKMYREHADGMQAIAYAYNVASAKYLADSFNAAGITAAEVDGTTPKEERDRLIKQYREGKITILTNAELFTEGLDLPNVDCVIMIRPTQSLSLFLQFSMRAMNPREGKTAIIIDHVDNLSRFGLPTDERNWQLAGEDKKKKARSDIPSPTTCPYCFASFYRKGRTTCPFCGHPLAKEDNNDGPQHVDVDLVEVTQSAAAQKRIKIAHMIQSNELYKWLADKRPEQLENYLQLQYYAKLHGYKPGWAWYQAKKRGFIR